MAYDLVVDSSYLNQGLTAIANSVRTKGGTSSPLAFPDGIKQAIDNIETGIMPTGTVNITANGTYDVADKATAVVNVEAGVDYLAKRADGSLTSYSNAGLTGIAAYGFANCTNLATLNTPNVNGIGTQAITETKLTEFIITTDTKLRVAASRCLMNNKLLAKVDFKSVLIFGTYTFQGCSVLETVILRNTDAVPTMTNKNAFTSTPVASGTGYIYVPSAMVDAYKAATNWSAHADQIRAIEDYPEITGG